MAHDPSMAISAVSAASTATGRSGLAPAMWRHSSRAASRFGPVASMIATVTSSVSVADASVAGSRMMSWLSNPMLGTRSRT